MLPIGEPVDLAMITALKSGSVRGYSVVPPVLTTWMERGERDSDIDKVEDLMQKGLFIEGSKNLRHSAREAMSEMFNNEQIPLTEQSEQQQLYQPPSEMEPNEDIEKNEMKGEEKYICIKLWVPV